jgi:hypothetical protein
MVVGGTNVPSGHENGSENASSVELSASFNEQQLSGGICPYRAMLKLVAWVSTPIPRAEASVPFPPPCIFGLILYL